MMVNRSIVWTAIIGDALQEMRQEQQVMQSSLLARDGHIGDMQRQMEDMEAQAQAELDGMHSQLLQLRQQLHQLQLALNESESKRWLLSHPLGKSLNSIDTVFAAASLFSISYKQR